MVTDLTGTEEIARYEYDAFNRRLKKTVGSVVTETVWDGWEPVEEYKNGQLQSRRLFGPELGELLRLEQDLDGNGTLEQTYLPVFDSLGHLAELRREDGTLVERYTYTPFGERRVFLPDTEPPRIEQVLAMPLEIRLEISEEVDLTKLRDALDTGITLRSQVTGLYFDVTIDQPPTDGCKPSRRLVLRKASTNPEDPWPEPNEPVEFHVAENLLTDRAGNVQSSSLTQLFPWPTQPAVIQDDIAPRVTTLVVEPAGTVLITFSEPPSLARLASVAKINGAAVSWTPLPEGYSVRSPRLAEGSYALTLSTADLDLADLGLIEPYALTFDVDGERHILKEEPPPGQVAASTVGNGIGFHGLGMDHETGLLYARNRYYDPEMGRFVAMDPLGYVDGPNGYQYGMNSPGNYSDRMGLCVLGVRCREVGSFYQDFTFGVALDAGAMVLGALDLLSAGSIADARARADAFLSTEGTLADRAQAAQAVDQGPRLNTITVGFYGAEDKLDHLKHLVGVAQIQQSGTILGTAVGLGDWEQGLEGTGKLLEGAGALSGVLSGGAGSAAKAGFIPKPGMAAVRSASTPLKAYASRGASWFEDAARNATQNPGSDRIVLGHFSPTGTSYQRVAAHYRATYFKVKNWKALAKGLTQDEIWGINETFLTQQVRQGKKILFSHDPLKARPGSFFEKEVTFLKDLAGISHQPSPKASRGAISVDQMGWEGGFFGFRGCAWAAAASDRPRGPDLGPL